MINRDLVEVLAALVLIVACARSAIATAQPRTRERSKRREPKRREEPARPATSSPLTHRERARPRILTGEPAASEARAPATRRAIKLVGGVTALAFGVAVGLLALVRALVAMFRKIGG